MKTFLTEKGNIPDGATHYSDESESDIFAWFKSELGVNYLWCPGIEGEEYWIALTDQNEMYGEEVKPIPQTNIETPEEKEALDSIDSNLIKPREMTQPRFSKCETVFSFSHGERRFILRGIDTDHPQLEVVRHETEAERVERERLENGQSLYELVQSLWCTVDSKYTPHPYGSPMVDDKTKEMYARLARAVDYRKESE